MRVDDFVAFITAREEVRQLKKVHVPWAGTDPIIAKYRFCNVRRNDDRVTKWIHGNVMMPNRNDPNLWFFLVAARLFNLPQSLDAIVPYLRPFRPDRIRGILHGRKAEGLNNFNAAYIVSTNGRSMDKVDYLLDCVLQPMWAARRNFTDSMRGASLSDLHTVLTGFAGLGSFMAAQVLADLKYADPVKWPDFHTFAASGPGSKRGLNRVMGRAATKNYNEARFKEDLLLLRTATNKLLGWRTPITAQDIQNCLCEFDKYERVRLGEGVPKQIYKPHGEKA